MCHTVTKRMSEEVTNKQHQYTVPTVYLAAYLANRTDTSAFATYTFPGLGALQSVLAVGTLATIYCVVASHTLPTGYPLQLI